jgi:hypothetical protein
MEAAADPRTVRTAALQVTILLALMGVVFRPIFGSMYEFARWSPEAVHAFAAPLLVAVLVYLRRRELAASLRPGSVWGLALILFSILFFIAARWPFNYAIVRRTAILPAAAGCILAVGGWRVLYRCVPILVLALIALPTGSRYYARVIILPETLTLQAVQSALELIPGTFVELNGLDLTYERGDRAGAIALGVSYRGASLFLSYLMICVFVTFVRIRPWWHIGIMAVLALPLMLMCNFLRLFIWGVATILTGAEPLDQTPRYVGTIASMLVAYAVSGVVLGGLAELGGRSAAPDAGDAPEPAAS